MGLVDVVIGILTDDDDLDIMERRVARPEHVRGQCYLE